MYSLVKDSVLYISMEGKYLIKERFIKGNSYSREGILQAKVAGMMERGW